MKNNVIDRIKGGFTIDGNRPIETEEWLLDKNNSKWMIYV